MKVISRSEFLEIEDKVIYSKFYKDNSHPSDLVEMKIGNFGDNDWVCQTISGGYAKDFQPSGVEWFSHKGSLNIDLECYGRDGLYESNEECKFLIFEKDDIICIISKLSEFL